MSDNSARRKYHRQNFYPLERTREKYLAVFLVLFTGALAGLVYLAYAGVLAE
jgi:hypothetical protein